MDARDLLIKIKELALNLAANPRFVLPNRAFKIGFVLRECLRLNFRQFSGLLPEFHWNSWFSGMFILQ